jgi:uncharacterized membrane protein YdjX (TVP38/TMEM64 family)
VLSEPGQKKFKLILIVAAVCGVAAIYFTGAYQEISFTNVRTNLDNIKVLYADSPVLMTLGFFLIYVTITSLSIPGAIVLTLLSGAVFGVLPGALLVSTASTVGATLAFLMSRYLFRDFFLKKHSKRFASLDKKIREKGTMYLFSMRMVPVSPFVVINVLMGLTSIKLWSYVWSTFLGMLPGTVIYVYAGRKISEISSPSEILTWPIVLTLSLLGLLPFILKFLTKGKKWEHAHS